MNTNSLSQALVDSGLETVGNLVYESFREPEPSVQTFIPREEERGSLEYPNPPPPEEDDECHCCCCTGECREDYDLVEIYPENVRLQDIEAVKTWREAEVNGTLEGRSLEDFGYVGPTLQD